MNTFLGACRDFQVEDLDLRAARRFPDALPHRIPLGHGEPAQGGGASAVSPCRSAQGIPVAFDLADPSRSAATGSSSAHGFPDASTSSSATGRARAAHRQLVRRGLRRERRGACAAGGDEDGEEGLHRRARTAPSRPCRGCPRRWSTRPARVIRLPRVSCTGGWRAPTPVRLRAPGERAGRPGCGHGGLQLPGADPDGALNGAAGRRRAGCAPAARRPCG